MYARTDVNMEKSGPITLENFDELYRKFGPMVLRRCRYLLKDEEQALDAMQDTFVRLIERRTRLSDVCSSLFYTVATTVSLNKIRSNKVRSSPETGNLLRAMAESGIVDHEKRVDASLLLDAIFAEAQEDTRCMAVLHYLDGLTLEETAREMRMSVSGIRKRLSVLRKKALRCAGV
ncbi:MAG TPA: sigma-70 family RNA polymerase sigma factor [Treponemataceae bacterium]|jgi:RNA polymerase sigma-70 factor (ECF subfamily)|nr:sigma-70 family RNA polymerase sigma factor [Treponemataceae bacterium]